MPRESKRSRPASKPAKPAKQSPRTPDGSKPKPSKPEPQSPLTSRRDERGVPYPGDWNNPLDGLTRGCF